MVQRIQAGILSILFFTASAAPAATRCDRILHVFGGLLADATCFESTDLTT